MVKQFLEDAHGRSLWVTKLAKAAREDLPALLVHIIRTEFTKMLAYIPHTCWDKYGPGTLNTEADRASMVVGLIKKHSWGARRAGSSVFELAVAQCEDRLCHR